MRILVSRQPIFGIENGNVHETTRAFWPIDHTNGKSIFFNVNIYFDTLYGCALPAVSASKFELSPVFERRSNVTDSWRLADNCGTVFAVSFGTITTADTTNDGRRNGQNDNLKNRPRRRKSFTRKRRVSFVVTTGHVFPYAQRPRTFGPDHTRPPMATGPFTRPRPRAASFLVWLTGTVSSKAYGEIIFQDR